MLIATRPSPQSDGRGIATNSLIDLVFRETVKK